MLNYPGAKQAAMQQMAQAAQNNCLGAAACDERNTAIGAIYERLAMLDSMAAEASRALSSFAERLSGPRVESDPTCSSPVNDGALGTLHSRIDSIQSGLNGILAIAGELQNVA